MNIGAMRERLEIKVPSSSADSAGDMGHPTWSDLATVWGQVAPLSGNERLRAAAMGSEIQYRVTLHYRNDVTAKAKLVCLGPDFEGSTMQIHTVIKDRARGIVTLDCSEVV